MKQKWAKVLTVKWPRYDSNTVWLIPKPKELEK